MSEVNKAICRRFIEQVWNNRNMAAIDELFAPNYVRHAAGGPNFGTGPDSVRKLVAYYRSAFPDVRFTIEDMIAEGDRVVVRWTANGTHRGTFDEVPASGQQISVTGTTTVRIAHGKWTEAWDNYDALELLQQIGALPQRAAGA